MDDQTTAFAAQAQERQGRPAEADGRTVAETPVGREEHLSGAVLLRRKPTGERPRDAQSPPSGRPRWDVYRPSFNVDIKGKSGDQREVVSNVGNQGVPRPRSGAADYAERVGQEASRQGTPIHPSNVGNGGYGKPSPSFITKPSFSSGDDFDPPAQDAYFEPAVPTKLKTPEAYRPGGRAGPDREIVKKLREAKKKQVVDRARSGGRDPNAGAREVSPGLTRSENTQQQYMERGRQLLARYRRERAIMSDDLLSLDTVEFVDWLFSLKPTLKPTTWRPYKQSAKAILLTVPDSDEAIALIDQDQPEAGSEPERKTSPGKPASRDLPRRTSAKKAKYIAKRDFDRIVGYLRFLSASRYGQVLADWLVAGVATGLRPAEWMATSLEVVEDKEAPGGRYVWLYVLNAKHTNNRANGAVRTIDLSETRDETLAAVRKMSERGREWLYRGEYGDHQNQCSQLMYHTCERMFPNRKTSYALTSTRHQFIANAKSYRRPEEVSAMVGHGVTDTAVENYGKKRSAWEPEEIEDRASPVEEEVATVKRRHVFYEERRRLLDEIGVKPRRPSSQEG